MKFSRVWLADYIDLSKLDDEELGRRFTALGHAVESVETHGDDTVFDLEITTNRVDAMSHLGMARELAAALDQTVAEPAPAAVSGQADSKVTIRIDAPEMCARYTAVVVRGVSIKPSPAKVQRRLEAVGLRPINNVVDATNYVMVGLGHPLHAFDLDKLTGATIVVRAGKRGEKMRSLDGEMREIDESTVVIADAARAVALGGVIGGAESEIGNSTKNILLECAWFDPSAIRRTARRLGMKTDASYRFERRVDPGDTVAAAQAAAQLIVETAGGVAEAPVDVVAKQIAQARLSLRGNRLREASAGVVDIGFAAGLLAKIGFEVKRKGDDLDVVVPSFRGDIHEEIDLIEEVLRFYGLDRIPAELPRLTTGDVRPNGIGDAEDEMRRIFAGSGLAEVVNYSFIHTEYNALFTSEPQIALTNALTENLGAMRLTLIPGLLENVQFNRSYGTRDGALFEIGKSYHRDGEGVRERRRAAIVMFGTIGSHWGDQKRPVDFFDVKGIVEQVAAKLHVPLTFAPSETQWLAPGKRAGANAGIASVGFVAPQILQRFGIKGEVAAAEIDVEALLAARTDWKMSQVARFPGIPMILAMTHDASLDYSRIVETIRSEEVPYLHEVGLRDRFVPPGETAVKTTLGLWYQAFDRSLTQEEVSEVHQKVADRVARQLPVKLLT